MVNTPMSDADLWESRDHFVVTSELVPPRDWKTDGLVEQARKHVGWVDAVDVSDNLLSVARFSPVVGAHVVKQVGIEPIVQINMRDRNRLAIQSDLLGVVALGVRHVVLLGGYPMRIGTEPDAKEVRDLDVVQAVRMIRRMVDEGVLFDGSPVSPLPRLKIGVVENLAGRSIGEFIDRLESKVEAGADFVRTQIVCDTDLFGEWMERARERGIVERARMMPSVLPLKNAAHMDSASAIPGIVIPDHVAARIRKADGPEAGLELAVELIRKLLDIPGVGGVHLRPLGGIEDNVGKILSMAGLRQPSRIGG